MWQKIEIRLWYVDIKIKYGRLTWDIRLREDKRDCDTIRDWNKIKFCDKVRFKDWDQINHFRRN